MPHHQIKNNYFWRMNEKKSKRLREMAEYIAKDKSVKGIKSVYKKLKWAKKKFKFNDL